jgi:ankyrin repeat protein
MKEGGNMKKNYVLLLILNMVVFPASADKNLDLGKAAWDGDVERVEELLASGADVNSWSNLGSHDHTPLMYAVYRGHCEVANILIDAGADVDTAHSTTHTVLYHALESYQLRTEMIQLLVDAGVSMSYTPLLWAIKNSSSDVVEIVAILIGAGADVNERDEYGVPALSNAVMYRRIQLLDVLLGSGAEINAVGDLRGRTALGWAVSIKAPNTVKQLIAAGADLEAIDKSGNTPLMIAKSNGSEEIVKLLIDAGAMR